MVTVLTTLPTQMRRVCTGKQFPTKRLLLKTQVSGAKIPKGRLTVLLAANMHGSQTLTPLVVGNSQNPRCLKNVKHVPVKYANNSNSWMTSEIWENWLTSTSTDRMRNDKWHILMLCDNCAAHAANTRLTNVTLLFSTGSSINFKMFTTCRFFNNSKVSYLHCML